jgi:hypothetical protein
MKKILLMLLLVLAAPTVSLATGIPGVDVFRGIPLYGVTLQWVQNGKVLNEVSGNFTQDIPFVVQQKEALYDASVENRHDQAGTSRPAAPLVTEPNNCWIGFTSWILVTDGGSLLRIQAASQDLLTASVSPTPVPATTNCAQGVKGTAYTSTVPATFPATIILGEPGTLQLKLTLEKRNVGEGLFQ